MKKPNAGRGQQRRRAKATTGRVEPRVKPQPRTEEGPNMRFRCRYGHVFEQAGGILLGGMQLTNESTGEVHNISMGDALWQATCPVCRASATAINQVTVKDGDYEVVGFADNAEHLRLLESSIEKLRLLSGDAGIEEIIEVLEQSAGEAGRPFVDYLRRNHIALAGLGISLVALIITMLQYLTPPDQEANQPPPPPGITRDQMERLIEEVKSDQPPTPLAHDQQIPDERKSKPRETQDRDASSSGGTTSHEQGDAANEPAERGPND